MKQERIIDLDGEQYRTLKRIIETHIPNKEVWAYGSRVKWKASIGADLDLVVFNCDFSTLAAFREALEESDLVISVDVMDWQKIPDDFKENIKKNYVVVHKNTLPAGWREVKLGDIGEFKTGKLNSNAEKENGIFPFFTCSPETLKTDKYAFNEEALILAGNNANGIFSLKYYKGKFNAYQRTYIININQHNEYKFIFYSLKQQLKKLELISHGTATKYLTLPILNSVLISLPPFSEQKAIAEVLSSLDDKIELLRRQNKTLETATQALFRKQITNNPSRENWEKVSLGDSTLSQMLNSGIKKFEGKKIYYATADIQGNNIINKSVMINYNKRPARANMQPVEFSVWFAKKGGRRKILMFNDYSDNTDDIILSTGFSGLKTNKLSHYYIWCYISGMEFQKTKDNMVTGTVQPDINNDGINDIQILSPDEDVLKEFNNKVESLFLKIQYNMGRICALENLRDMLLPKFISRQIRVN